ncbi:hypothetical protein [Bythopirellula polymerisocia]|nr:hypothetical protein [Bythopirellula polymerisocia]
MAFFTIASGLFAAGAAGIGHIVGFGAVEVAVTVAITVWAWRWRYKESGALVAFCLGPLWGLAIAGIYIFVFQGANLDDGWAHISFVYHGVICGISLAIFFSILQFVTLQFAVRQDYETRPDSEFCQKDKVSDTSMAIQLIEIHPDDDLRKPDDASETSTAAKPIETRPLSHKSKAVLTVIAVAMLLGIAWWMTAPKTHDMRYGEPSDWTEEFASDFPGSEIESAGITNLGRFYLINSEQLIIASLATPSQLVTLALPNALKIPFNSYWRVSEDETGQRIICSNQYNNMAVWNLAEPQRPQYV